MAAEREETQVFRDAYVLVKQQDSVLLVLRGKHLYRGGQWGLPSGQVHSTDTYLGMATRKLRDEVGLVTVDSLRFVHLLERVTSNGDHWVAAFFTVNVDAFEPANTEPSKARRGRMVSHRRAAWQRWRLPPTHHLGDLRWSGVLRIPGTLSARYLPEPCATGALRYAGYRAAVSGRLGAWTRSETSVMSLTG